VGDAAQTKAARVCTGWHAKEPNTRQVSISTGLAAISHERYSKKPLLLA
jgi:hypothetical protein